MGPSAGPYSTWNDPNLSFEKNKSKIYADKYQTVDVNAVRDKLMLVTLSRCITKLLILQQMLFKKAANNGDFQNSSQL